MPLRFGERLERSKISAFPGFRVLLSRIQPILTGFKFANHGSPRCSSILLELYDDGFAGSITGIRGPIKNGHRKTRRERSATIDASVRVWPVQKSHIGPGVRMESEDFAIRIDGKRDTVGAVELLQRSPDGGCTCDSR